MERQAFLILRAGGTLLNAAAGCYLLKCKQERGSGHDSLQDIADASRLNNSEGVERVTHAVCILINTRTVLQQRVQHVRLPPPTIAVQVCV